MVLLDEMKKVMSPYFAEASIWYFAKFNFNYKDLEEYFHALSINQNVPVETVNQIYAVCSPWD